MRIVIVGYGEMFQSLISGVLNTKHEVVGVFRHEQVLYNPIKRFFHDAFKPSNDFNFVRSLGLHDIKAKSVNSEDFRKQIKKLKADIILVASWSERFETETLNLCKCVNVHPSLLPKFRGPNPYLQAILHGEIITGITFHLMDVGYDSGPILYQTSVNILPEDTGYSLKLKCCDTAKKVVTNSLDFILARMEKPISQEEKLATYYSHIKLKDIILEFEKETSIEIDKKIRAFYPWYKCVIPYKNQFFEFENYEIIYEQSNREIAEIVKKTKDSLCIVCADKKIIKFEKLKIKQPFSKFLTKFFMKKIIKIGTKAV